MRRYPLLKVIFTRDTRTISAPPFTIRHHLDTHTVFMCRRLAWRKDSAPRPWREEPNMTGPVASPQIFADRSRSDEGVVLPSFSVNVGTDADAT